jgi:hypothetical protein
MHCESQRDPEIWIEKIKNTRVSKHRSLLIPRCWEGGFILVMGVGDFDKKTENNLIIGVTLKDLKNLHSLQ